MFDFQMVNEQFWPRKLILCHFARNVLVAMAGMNMNLHIHQNYHHIGPPGPFFGKATLGHSNR
jgi:hypothetical protein